MAPPVLATQAAVDALRAQVQSIFVQLVRLGTPVGDLDPITSLVLIGRPDTPVAGQGWIEVDEGPPVTIYLKYMHGAVEVDVATTVIT